MSSGSSSDDVVVLRGRWPPVLDGDGMRALLVPLLATLTWTAGAFREIVSGTSVDPLALLLHLLALVLTLRASLLGAELVRRLRIALRAHRGVLVLVPEGLYLRQGAREMVLPRGDVVAVVERGRWQHRTGVRRWSEVHVLANDLERRIEIAPIFDHGPGVLAERLMRWAGPPAYVEHPRFPPPAPLASKIYDEAARGVSGPGTLVVRHGAGWIRRGPYASALLGIVLLEGWLRLEPSVRSELAPIAAFSSLLAFGVPYAWWRWTIREVSVRRGVALVMTPAELMLRTRAGVHRVPWPRLQRVRIEARRGVSVVDGVHESKTLVIERRDEPPIRYDEAFLGLPAEVVQALLDAYRTGTLPRSDVSGVASAPDAPSELVQPTDERTADETRGDRPEPRSDAFQPNVPAQPAAPRTRLE